MRQRCQDASAVYKPTKNKAKTVRALHLQLGRPPSAKPLHVDVANTDRCDLIASGQCLSPFPQSYTVPDGTRPPGCASLNWASMPVNKDARRSTRPVELADGQLHRAINVDRA